MVSPTSFESRVVDAKFCVYSDMQILSIFRLHKPHWQIDVRCKEQQEIELCRAVKSALSPWLLRWLSDV